MANDYDGRLKTLDRKFPILLENWKKYYVFSRKTPDYPEYTSQLARATSGLDSIDMELQKIKASIAADVAQLNAQAARVNTDLDAQSADIARLGYEQTQIDAKAAAAATRERNFQHELAAAQWRHTLLLVGLGLLTIAVVAV